MTDDATRRTAGPRTAAGRALVQGVYPSGVKFGIASAISFGLSCLSHSKIKVLTEARFQATVTDLANRLGWYWMHIQPGLTDRGRYRTAVSGSLGPGWPDLVMVKGGRLLFVELKAERGKVTGMQENVLEVLGSIPFAEVHVWRPSDWDRILDVLS